ESDLNVTEEVKWGTAVWTCNGLVCAVGAFKPHVKINFFKGASLNDPKHLFNAGLDAKATRAIDFTQDARLDEPALRTLMRAAVAHNQAPGSKKKWLSPWHFRQHFRAEQSGG